MEDNKEIMELNGELPENEKDVTPLSDNELKMVSGGIDENYNNSGGEAMPPENADSQGRMQHQFVFSGKNIHEQ